MFAFFMMIAALAIGAMLWIGILLYIPPYLFSIPYYVWVGPRGREGIPSRPRTGLAYIWHEAGNAAKLYRSWITKKPHGIVDISKLEKR